ncbi:MAG: hypothetical protein ACREC5_04865 [Thermoplasmata archaeon]
MEPPTAPGEGPGQPPRGFHLCRELPVGRHPLLKVFPGLDRMATARRMEPESKERQHRFRTTQVELVAQDLWMYVAPRQRLRTMRSRRFRPVLSPDVDCIVVGAEHLRTSPALTLYLDIFHELCHLRQRDRGEELFDRPESYVRRPTEIEAYRFVVEEARRLRISDAYLREYLRVEWITPEEFTELLAAMGVAAA